MDEGGKVVEILIIGTDIWSKTVLRDWEFVFIQVMNYSSDRMRLIEGSMDGGVTWKERYEDELILLGKDALSMQWRIKEG